jgi:hypothetical protein
MKQEYRAVKDYQINIDYNIDELMKIANNDFVSESKRGSGKSISRYRNKILDGFNGFNDFKENIALMGIRTTLENELKISKTEALNYLTGFPLNFKLKSFVKILYLWFDYMEVNGTTNIEKINFLISQKKETTEEGHIAKLIFDFEKKKKLIERNFESDSHIDIQEFLAWADSKGFITLK